MAAFPRGAWERSESGQTSRVTWSGRFTPVGVSDEAAVELFTGIYREGLAALRANFPD